MSKLVLLFLLLSVLASATYLHYSPVHFSNCIGTGGDSPEGLFLDGFYVYDGPNHETNGPFPYRIDYIASWAEFPSAVAQVFNGDICQFWSKVSKT